jgi:hypothetical protein
MTQRRIQHNSRTRVICPEGNFIIKNSVNPCKLVLSLSNGSVSKKLLCALGACPERSRRVLCGYIIYKFPVAQDLPLYTCKAASTNSPFFAKQTQSSLLSAQKPQFRQKTNPIQTQFLPAEDGVEGGQTQSNPNLYRLGNLGNYAERSTSRLLSYAELAEDIIQDFLVDMLAFKACQRFA